MKFKQQPSSIEQWYDRVITLDRNQRESRREEKRLRGQQEQGQQAPRQKNRKTQLQQLPWPQVWPRRQEAPQQQVQAGPTPMEEVERTNVVRIVITMGNLNIWLEIVEIEEWETELGKVEDWNMDKEIMDNVI